MGMGIGMCMGMGIGTGIGTSIGIGAGDVLRGHSLEINATSYKHKERDMIYRCAT